MEASHDGKQSEARLSFYRQHQLVQQAKNVFLKLAAVLKNASLYPPAHPFLLGSAEQFLLSLEHVFVERNDAAFYFVSGELFFGSLSVPVEEVFSEVVEDLVRREIGGLTFKKGLTRQEVVALAFFLNRLQGESAERLTKLAAAAGITKVDIHPLRKPDESARGRRERGQGSAKALYRDGVEAVIEFMQSAQQGKLPNVRRVQMLVQSMADSILDNRDALVGLTTIRMYDEYTFAHSVNVAVLSLAMGAYLSLDRLQIASLGVAGLLHDIGKVSIPHGIINKPDNLADQEWEIVKRHPVEGAKIISEMTGVSRLALVAAFEHHRQYDLKGYPRLSGDDGGALHPFSRIVAIADAYDAMTSARVYFSAMMPPHEAARVLLAKRRGAFDPALVKAFINMVGIFPIGTLLMLNTGDIGLVVHQTRDLLRPRVLILKTFDGAEKEEVSLLETVSGSFKRSIVATIDPSVLKVDPSRYFQ